MYPKKGSATGEGADLNRLLAELHAKRRWLDEVIEGLEAVVRSPEVKFVKAVTDILREHQGAQPKVDVLSGQRRRLARLSYRISNSAKRREGPKKPARS